MGQREITDIELNEGSMGVDEDVHYDINCLPVEKIGTYRKGSLVIVPNVVAYFRKCTCGYYKERDQVWRQSCVTLPTDGVSIHRPTCSFIMTWRKGFKRIDGEQRTCYTYQHACTCRYTRQPNTALRALDEVGKFLVYMYTTPNFF